MKSKRISARRASRRHRRFAQHLPCVEAPASRDHVYVDAAILFTDSHAAGRSAVWLDPQADGERAYPTSTY
ncbi:MAG TPA: hypothetical protein VKB41_01925 [Steroidobacteraceae bacterium]|jgi:hypothetical protein|nr:hypothetical protein [Steroidobacteraceae bacterium]